MEFGSSQFFNFLCELHNFINRENVKSATLDVFAGPPVKGVYSPSVQVHCTLFTLKLVSLIIVIINYDFNLFHRTQCMTQQN